MMDCMWGVKISEARCQEHIQPTWLMAPFPRHKMLRENKVWGRRKIINIDWDMLDLRYISDFHKGTIKICSSMARCGWKLQWLIQDARQLCIHEREQKTPRHLRSGDVINHKVSYLGNTKRSRWTVQITKSGHQPVVVTCLHCLYRRKTLSITVCVISFWK